MKNKIIKTIIIILGFMILMVLSIKLDNSHKPIYPCLGNRGYIDGLSDVDRELETSYFFALKYSEPKINQPIKLYYTTNDNQNYYLYCLDDIILNFENDILTLKEALISQKTNSDDLLRYFVKRSTFSSGAYFTDKNFHSIFGISLIKCNELLDAGSTNDDIYLGPIFLEFENQFCKR